jgi:hypothetical protein
VFRNHPWNQTIFIKKTTKKEPFDISQKHRAKTKNRFEYENFLTQFFLGFERGNSQSSREESLGGSRHKKIEREERMVRASVVLSSSKVQSSKFKPPFTLRYYNY